MANGIFNILTNKIFPATAPDSQTESGKLKEAPFAPPITNSEAGTALNHITEQFVAQQNSANRTAAVRSSTDGDTEKTVTDFLREIKSQQPFDEAALAKKKVSVELKLGKPPQEMSVADYDAATWKAIFNKAGYSILTDKELGMAVQALKNTGYKSTDDGFTLSNLREFDALPGPMFVKTDQATIEKAKRAGQAVLQYQEYKAKGVDEAIESGKNYVNGALGGFVEKPYNAVVNNINGLSEPFRAGEQKVFGTNYLPELPRSTIGDKSEYWQQKRYGNVSLNMMGEGAATIQVGIMTGRPLYNSRIGALLGVQVGVYNVGVGATGNDPLHPGREMNDFERGSRIVGGAMGVVSAPFSAGGRVLSNDALTFPNAARNTVRNLDEIFRPPSNPPLAPAGNVPGRFGTRIFTGKTPVEKMGEPMEISISADEANLEHIHKGRQAPYGGTRAREIILENDTIFVRVHGEKNQTRSWMMRAKDIEGLTARQIKDKFALPELPKYISDVYVPKGTRIITGKVALQKGWGKGGGIQYELKDELPTSAWKNRRLLK